MPYNNADSIGLEQDTKALLNIYREQYGVTWNELLQRFIMHLVALNGGKLPDGYEVVTVEESQQKDT